EEHLRALPAAFRERGNLRVWHGTAERAVLEGLVLVAQNLLNPEVALEDLDVVPHQYERLLLRVDAQEVRLREFLLEGVADREALGETRAIVELEHRHRAARILRDKLG